MILLASRSPRRRDLLAQLGVDFEVLDPRVDERAVPDESAEALVRRLAIAKAEAGRAALGGYHGDAAMAIGADTEVILDDQPLGKPNDAEHACAILERLSGRCHTVLSAVALARVASTTEVRVSKSRVCFRALSRDECRAYAASGEPLDKAGGYAIQGRAAAFVRNIEGSYSGVVGLPLFETAELLREAGVRVL